jgi:predicted dehydrogenase
MSFAWRESRQLVRHRATPYFCGGTHPLAKGHGMAETAGWGILATGRIAGDFARDLQQVPGARIAAVGSRSTGSAEAFAQEYGGPECRPHGSYADLVADPDVDVVYVATPHALHVNNSRMALEAGKHVLCEKPLTINTAEAEGLVRLAREQDRFLMEAMWMACHPIIRAVRDGLDAGRFGTPRVIHAEIGFAVHRPHTDRLLDPGLGGGALLDMGVYPLTLADLMLGPATEVHGTATLNDDGIDTDIAISGRHPGGALSSLTATITSYSGTTATIATDSGRIDIASLFFSPPRATWFPEGGEPEDIHGIEPVLGQGFGNEAAEVQRCVAAGLLESPLVPHEQTLRIMGEMDDLRHQIGVVYPGERR